MGYWDLPFRTQSNTIQRLNFQILLEVLEISASILDFKSVGGSNTTNCRLIVCVYMLQNVSSAQHNETETF